MGRAEERTYLYRGIAERNFERKFQLAENIHVKGANPGQRSAVYRAGTCDSGREKPRRIEIN